MLNYTVTEKAYLDFNMYHVLNSPYLRKQAKLLRVLPPLILVFLFVGDLFLWAGPGRRFPPLFPAAVIGLAILWFTAYQAYYRKSMEKRLKGYIREGNGQEFLGEQSLELLDDRIRTVEKNGVRETPYHVVEKLVENEGCLYIFIGAMTAIIVPLETLDGSASYPDFRNHLEDKVRQAKAAERSPETRPGTAYGQ